MSDIYVVDVDDENEVSILTRYVVVDESAEDAALHVAGMAWPAASEEARASMASENAGRVRVGRLGPYQPGIEGGRMSRGDAVAIQRIGQR